MAEMLTPAQKTAIHDRGGKLLVSAAAGSGKTKVLVDRLLSYISDPINPCNIDDFLIITYTKAAATELRGKIAQKLAERVAESPGNKHLQKQIQRLYLAQISTVHSFCTEVLRENAYRLDVAADFRVADERECGQIQHQVIEKILDHAYESVAQDSDFQTFIETQGFGRDDRMIPDIILQVYHASQCHLSPEGWLEECIANTQTDDLTDASQTVWGAYLLEDLHHYLDLQIAAISKCAQLASVADGMAKVAALLADTRNQLEHLRNSKTWDEVVAKRDIDFGRLTFPKSCSDEGLKESIKAVRDACKKRLAQKLAYFASDSRQVLVDLKNAGAAARGLIKLVKTFSLEYNKAKKYRHVLDFSDLEHKTLDLVLGKKRSGPTILAHELGAQYREIMVDEYQDSNAVQDAIFSALTSDRQNCFMVGDVKQSIYQFRLADPGIFLEKYNTYFPAEEASAGQGRRVLLSHNFRSASSVIHAVNDVFTTCMSENVGGLIYGADEWLNEGIPHIRNTEPEVELHAIQVDHDTYAEEAVFTADRIAELLDGSHMVRQGDMLRPIVPDDIVILLRSPGSVGAEFLFALERKGIRCTTGAGTDLLQTEEIGTLRSLLQVISNPLQDIPLLAVLTSRVFMFTADDLAVMRTGKRFGSIYDALKASSSEKCKKFLNLLDVIRREARLYGLSELLERIFSITHLDTIFSAASDGDVRTSNLHAFCQLASECEFSGQKELDQFLDFLSSLEEKGLSVSGDQKQSGAVTIMSIHKSKGLEFPVVFLCGLSKGFNLEDARAQVLCDKDLGLGLSCVDLKNRVRYPTVAKRAIANKKISDSISEEMRVLYVAMTRARDRLVMTYADKDLELHLSELVGRMDLSPMELLTKDVSCAGTWVLLTALRKTEAGQLFAIGGKPTNTASGTSEWKIRVVQSSLCDETADIPEESYETGLDSKIIDRMHASLNYVYPYLEATQFPSKQTATQLKGRPKDNEAAENTDRMPSVSRQWRTPSFVGQVTSGAQYGTAVHTIMQHIQFDRCTDSKSIGDEISRLVQERYITIEEARMIDIDSIDAFFKTDFGKQLISCPKVLREFKFSILDDAKKYGCNAEGEKVLLQGVVDCALIETDGITVIDFKTDRVTSDTIASTASQYEEQVKLYADALSRIFETNIKTAQLYFFRINQFVQVI